MKNITEKHRKIFQIVTVLIAMVFPLGCSSVGGQNVAQNSDSLLVSGKSIGQVIVTMDKSLPPDKTALAQEYRLQAELEHQLGGFISTEGGSLDISINIIEFRLLSAWTAGLGVSDFINVDVTASEDGVVLKSFQSGVKSFRGHSRSARLKYLAEKLSKEIATNI